MRGGLIVHAEQVGRQTAVDELQLGALDHSLAKIGRPRRQQVDEEDRVQQGEVALGGALRQPQVTGDIGLVEQAADPTGE